MFTGIVEEVGSVVALESPPDPLAAKRLDVRAATALGGLKLGDSVAVNGACLTVVSLDGDCFSVDLAPETLRRTNLGSVAGGSRVNLERPLAVGDRLGGHVVQGHVDGTGRITSARPEGDCVILGARAPRRLMPYIVEKGFLAIDGASLTVVKKGALSFTISLIPYTLDNTNFRDRDIGSQVNLEVDIMAKYVESLLGSYQRA